jgi:hypothetical protein
MNNNNTDPTPNPSPTWEGSGYRLPLQKVFRKNYMGGERLPPPSAEGVPQKL